MMKVGSDETLEDCKKRGYLIQLSFATFEFTNCPTSSIPRFYLIFFNNSQAQSNIDIVLITCKFALMWVLGAMIFNYEICNMHEAI